MDRQKTIFLAFAGRSIEQSESILEIQDGYECWDLKKFTLEEFIDTLKKKIPPINNNVLRHYNADEGRRDIYGITKKQYEECSWGLLIPDGLDDAIAGNYPETIFLLNLYSPKFLYPLFFASDFGITRPSHDRVTFEFAHYQNQAEIFKTAGFVNFFKLLLPQTQYGVWQLDRTKKWNKEDWRLFVAGQLFSGLKDYDNRKYTFGWQRESADMASTLEALFTAGDDKNEEVGYRLRKRIATLLFWKFPDIEKEVSELYTARSAFVHGSFFSQIAKDSTNGKDLPLPDFGLLYKQKEYVRFALVAYLHLAQLLRQNPAEYKDNKIIITTLERGIMDLELRAKIAEEIKALFALMPESSFKLVY